MSAAICTDAVSCASDAVADLRACQVRLSSLAGIERIGARRDVLRVLAAMLSDLGLWVGGSGVVTAEERDGVLRAFVAAIGAWVDHEDTHDRAEDVARIAIAFAEIALVRP